MPHPSRCRRLARPVCLAAALGLACAVVTAPAADAVIMSDGFMIQGSKAKQENNPTGYGFDVLADGPKYVIFSAHTRKGAKVEKDIERPQYVSYNRKVYIPASGKPPGVGEMKADDFNEKWAREVRIKPPGGGAPTVVKQVIDRLDPYYCHVVSTTHKWSLAFHTAEMDPKVVRMLLSKHADLEEAPGKPDALKRVAIATFMKDAGWLDESRKEIERAHKDIPGAWPKEAADQEEKLRGETDLAETRLVLDDIDAAVNSGRFDYAGRLLASFKPKAAEPKETTRLAVLKAQVDVVRPKFEETCRLLSELIHRETGGPVVDAYTSAFGGPVSLFAPRQPPAPAVAGLIPAAKAVLAELHPSNLDRVEIFANVAGQADKRRRDGKEPAQGESPAELFALAITGWLKGKNGGEPVPASALKCWATREMALAYLRDDSQNDRSGKLQAYLQSGQSLAPDELSQVISLIPPPFAEDLTKPLGKEAPKADTNGQTGVFLRSTPGSNPTQYYLHLPPGYHHGRSYPLVLLLSHHTVAPEKMLGIVAPWADKFGYILAAPVWGNTFSETYDWSGDAHPMATDVIRDVLRRFQADPDRVFPFGLGEGANFAFDLGASHPDLFAGVVAMGPTPRQELFMHYWRNAQVLPYFVVTGEMGGDSPSKLRHVFEKWMPRGFPALMTQYRGRGVEWYGMELPRIFDWMNRKIRARGTSALRLNSVTFEPWQIGRDADNRFYWVGTTGVRRGHVLNKGNVAKGWVPASLEADIRPGNDINVRTLGLQNAVIWLEREMIDWSKPVRVTLNGSKPPGYTAKVMQPDLGLMFEELYRTGDRKILMLGRLEFATP